MPNKVQLSTRSRLADIQRQSELASGGYPTDFVGPAAPLQGATPEQAAAAALAKARFFAQQQMAAPPRPEDTGISGFARSGVGGALTKMFRPRTAARNELILSGQPEQEFAKRGLASSTDEAQAAIQGMGVQQTGQQMKNVQQQMLDAETQRKLDEVTRETLAPLASMNREQFIEQAPGLIGKAGALGGKPDLIGGAIGLYGDAAKSKDAAIKSAQQDSSRKYLGKVFEQMQANPELFEDPGTLRNALTVNAFILGDTDQLQRAVEGLTGDAREAADQANRTKALQKQLDQLDQQERESIFKGATELSALIPAGTDFNTILGISARIHGKSLDQLDPDFLDALKSLEAPLVKMNKLKQDIEAQKTVDAKWDQINQEYEKLFDQKGEPTGWLKSVGNDPGPPQADGSKLTMKEFVLENFQKRINDLLTGSKGVSQDQLDALTPGMLALNEKIQADLEAQRKASSEEQKTRNFGAFRTIEKETSKKETPSIAGGTFKQ